MNNNGYLSLAEIDKGIRDVLQLPELFELKPVIIRAYAAAKNKIKAAHTFGDDYVSKAEFRYLLIYLRQYYHLWILFDTLDVTTKQEFEDRRLSEEEFIAGQPHLAAWGIKVKDPKAKFEKLLKDNNAEKYITFTQFCNWACCKHLRQHADAESHEELD